MTTQSRKSIISNLYINKDFVCSDHFPLCVTICSNTVENEIRNIPKWNQLCDSDICEYKSCTYTLSRDVVIPNKVLLCRDTKCSIHNQNIDSFYNSIMSVFKQATMECIPSSSNCNKKFVPIPRWNEYVKEHHKIARDAFK